MRARTASSPRRRALGLSLIEILVGVAIGLIGIVAIFQAVAVWSKHTSTTSSGGDAQVAGTLALFEIERDLKQAGHGFAKAGTPVLGCPVAFVDNALVRAFNFGLSPVAIAASAGGAPDTISILYGESSFYGAEGSFTDATATTKKLRRRAGFKKGDLAVVAVNAGASAATANCELVEINDDSDIDGYTVDHSAAPYNSYYAPASSPMVAPRFNGASAPLVASGTIYNLGPQPRLDVWSIQANRILARTDLIHATAPMQIAEGVVNLKAEYGIDANADGTIGPANGPTSRRPTGASCSRSGSRSWSAAASSSATAIPARAAFAPSRRPRTTRTTSATGRPHVPDDQRQRHRGYVRRRDADPNNWRYYRYRVYERVIPLRNMLWGTTE